MAERLRAVAAGSWLAVAAVLIAGAVLAWPVSHGSLDWQPARAASEPWRALSAVFVHYSVLHLAANVAGGALVAALGQAARANRACALAWLVAWPLTQIGLFLQPALAHYGGLSGVLHAGVAIIAVHLLAVGTPRQRGIGAAILLALLGKVLGERPWAGPLAHPPGWDIAVAPLAHASGLVAGVLCAVIAEALVHRAYHRRP